MQKEKKVRVKGARVRSGRAGTRRAGSENRRAKNLKRIRLPRAGVYRVAATILRTRLRHYNVNIIREPMGDVKPPFVVLSNHTSKQDWVFVGVGMLPHLLNVVVTTYYYTKPGLRVLLKLVGAIPKDQFSPDVTAMKNILSVADRGGNIMLFPEGRMTPSGESETFERSTVKLLRRLGRPVVGIHFDGAYLSMPKWNDKVRRGRIDMRIFPLVTADELQSMTDDEIYERMTAKLYTDEFAWQRENRVAFAGGHCAEGLQNVLYMCPRCGAEMTTVTDGDVISCTACGNGARLNDYYDLTPLDSDCVIPESISEWYKWEKAQVRALAESEEALAYSGRAVMRQIVDSKKWLQTVGEGELSLDREGLTYAGTRCDEPFVLRVPLSALPAAAFDPGRGFELYYRGIFYSFELEEGQSAQKWSMLIEQLHDVCCGKPAATEPEGAQKQ